MIFHILTIFPSFFEGPLQNGVVSKAAEAGKLEVRIHNLRDWTQDRHHTVDDRPFGGGEGMLLKAEPVFSAAESIFQPTDAQGSARRIILLSAQGKAFDQAAARRLAGLDEMLLICGRYEGVDERIVDHLVDEELSIGDFVLSGGELAAAVVLDTVARLLPGVLGNEASTIEESFSDLSGDGSVRLDCPQYTRPAEFRGWKVPEVLLGGNHAEIRRWRREAALAKTLKNRPDLIETAKNEIASTRREAE